MGFIKEFKEFAMRGNLVDTAVAFVMGVAFGKIVSAFVEGMVMPLVAMLTGGVDFSAKKIILKSAAPETTGSDGVLIPAVTEVSIKYGVFITNLIDFMIVAFAVFLVIKAINSMKKAEVPPPPPGPTQEEILLTEIRDLLKKQ
jgi:large conductance mechanosensitive channel